MPMQICPYCLEEIQPGARKCKHCGSALQSDAEPDKATGDTVFIVDKGLMRFAKFALAILAIFIVFGTYIFGFDIKKLAAEMRTVRVEIQKEQVSLNETRTELAAAKAELDKTLAELGIARADIDKALQTALDSAANAEVQVVKIQAHLSRAGYLVAEIEQTRILSDDARQIAESEREALLTSAASPGDRPEKLWPVGQVLRVRYLGGTAQQHADVERHARVWEEHANVTFEFGSAAADAEVRVSFNPQDGSWTYIGTDALGVPTDQPTMNLGWIQQQNVVHEFGHVLGLVHEHQNPMGGPDWNRERVVASLSGAPNYWDEDMIERTIFQRLNADQYPGSRRFDPSSIMGYAYPAEWLLDGVPISPGDTLSASDKRYVAGLYPKT